MYRNSKRAFTLVELLVVITIIGMLVALLLPAVQAAREAARNLSCKNNLTQLGLGVINFEGAKGRYPGIQDTVGGNKRGTYIVQILPYIDQQPLFDKWRDPAVPWLTGTGGINPNLVIDMKTLVCPSVSKFTSGANSYVCNAGFYPRSPASNNATGSNAVDPAPFDDPAYFVAAGRTENGIFLDRILMPKAKCELSDVRDGTSNTLLLAENLSSSEWYDIGDVVAPHYNTKLRTGFVWLYMNQNSTIQVDPRYGTNTIVTPNWYIADNSGNNLPQARVNGLTEMIVPPTPELARPSAFHPGHANVCFADKHTIGLNEDIDYHVYQQLCTPYGKRSDMPWRTYQLKASDYDH